MQKSIKGLTVEIGGDTTKLGKALKESSTQSTQLQRELNAVNKLLKFDSSNTVLLKQKQELLTESISKTKEKLEVLKKTQEQVQVQFDKGEITEEQYREFQREIVNTEKKLKSLEQQQKEFGNVASQQMKNAGKSMEDFGDKVKNAGSKMRTLSAISAGILSGTVIMASNFQDAMAKVNTIADTTQVPLDELRTSIVDLSNTTGVSCNDIAENVYQAISAGQKTGDAVNFVGKATELARAGFAETGNSLDILTTILNAYGLEAKEVNRVSDILIQTQNLGKTTVGELSVAMGKVIPTAKANNVALEQVASSYSILTAKGINTAESTTYLNSMLNELGKGGTKVSDILKKKTNKSFSELMASGESLGDVLELLEGEAKKSGKSFGDLWSSAEASKAATTLLGDSANEFNGRLKEMSESSGATARAIEKLETPSHKAKVAINQLKNIGVEFGDVALEALTPVLDGLVNIAKDLFKWYTNLSTPMKQLITGIAGVTAVAAPLLSISGSMIKNIGTTVNALGGLVGKFTSWKVSTDTQTVSQGLLNTTMMGMPVAWLLAGVAAVAGALYVAGEALAASREEFMKEKESIDANIKAREEYVTAANDKMNTEIAEIDSVKNLKEELDSLVDSNGNIVKGYEDRAEFILGRLNEALGTEYKMTDLLSGKYNELSDSIDTLLDKQRAEAILTADKEKFDKAIIEIENAKLELIKREDAYLQRKKDNDSKILELKTKMASATEYEKKTIQDKIDALEEDTIQSRVLYEEQNTLVEGYYADITNYETNYTLFKQGNAESLAAINSNVSQNQATTVSEYKRLIEDKIRADQKEVDYLINQKAVTVDEATKSALQKQIDAKNKTIANEQEKLDGIINMVTSKSPLYDNEVKSMALKSLSSFDGDSNKYFGVSQKKLDNVVKGLKSKDPAVRAQALQEAQTMYDSLSSKNDKYSVAGRNIIDGILNGTNSKVGTLYSTMGTYGESMLREFKNSLGIKSPSRKFIEASKWIPEGIAIGVEQSEDKVYAKMGNVGERAIQQFNDIAKTMPKINLADHINGEINAVMPWAKKKLETNQRLLLDVENNMNDINLGRQIEYAFKSERKDDNILKEVTDILSTYLPKIVSESAKPIYLDSNKLVSLTVDKYDQALGRRLALGRGLK